MPKKIALLGTLDTKGPEIQFARQLIERCGHIAVTIDCGIMGSAFFTPTITRHQVAAAAGTTIAEILTKADKNYAIKTMTAGSIAVVERLCREREMDGILALGGGQGTVMGTNVMQALPFGIPKVMVSAVANGQTAFGPFVGTRDITIIHSVADVLGLNMVTRRVLAEGVGAVTGMVEMDYEESQSGRPAIAMTTAGVTTLCAMRARDILESRGYEVIAFHCNGVGAKAMEELVEEGRIAGVLDISPHDITDRLFGGIFPAAPDRMEATCRRGIPQVIVPGTTDFILFAGVESVPPEMLKRKHVLHNPIHTHVRTTFEEMWAVGRFVAERLARSMGPAQVLIPGRGFTALNVDGGPMYDPRSDAGFLAGLSEELNRRGARAVQVELIDLHINDPRFADTLAERIDAMVRVAQPSAEGVGCDSPMGSTPQQKAT
jgi:uncharacterized protein (UPF0261 family)